MTNCIEDYTYAVSQNLWTLQFPEPSDIATIEEYYFNIITAIKSAEKDILHTKVLEGMSNHTGTTNLLAYELLCGHVAIFGLKIVAATT